MTKKEMEENYETLEEELGQLRAEPPPQKPDQQIHSPETYATKNIQEEMSPPRPGPEPKISAKDPSFSETAYPSKTLPTQNLSETETPWENITLNHCLFVTITILVITSGFHKLHGKSCAWGTRRSGRMCSDCSALRCITTQTMPNRA
ncbi:uncharacterized protein LOC117522004 isoform X4 [Thalassophryne amazonica]|uniref:uncharacterized protein LOC117522004 isoform X4 n=1 Tax=Thalassophryne amazonica TaxID=390379 RepID=UPI00147223BA|nr:uncharacterized protein LOC117522004 isoform X4 [Thalassophryne amazonica]